MRSMGRMALVAFALGGWSLALPVGARAQCGPGANVPNDNSEIHQYLETVPSTCGNEPSGQHDQGSGTGGGPGSVPGQDVIPPASLQQLEGLGNDGEGAAAFAQDTAPGSSTPRKNSDRGEGPDRALGDSPMSDPSGGESKGAAVAGVGRALGGNSSGGVGILLPLFLGTVLLLGIAYVLRARVRAGAGVSRGRP